MVYKFNISLQSVGSEVKKNVYPLVSDRIHLYEKFCNQCETLIYLVLL